MPLSLNTHGIARITKPTPDGLGEKHVGMAIILDPRRVMTCCHVLSTALGRQDPLDPEPPPGATQFLLRFPYASNAMRSGRVVRWGLGLPQPKDVAVLELLEEDAPAAAGVAAFSEAEVEGKNWSCIGRGADEFDRQSHGILGTILPSRDRQLNGPKELAPRIAGGNSGAGVWSDATMAFVGMVVTRDRDQFENGLAYAIPTDVLLEVWPELPIRTPEGIGSALVKRMSAVMLIDASLDPRDSHYEQVIEDGKQVIRLDPCWKSRGHKICFPAIDFKFQNAGDATAFLWRFDICLLQVEVDRTPFFSVLDGVSEDGALRVYVRNNGWGAAHDCNLVLHEPTLDRLFPASSCRYTGTIGSDASVLAFRLTPDLVAPGIWEVEQDASKLLPTESPIAGKSFSSRLEDISPPGIMLEHAHVLWDCKGEGEGNSYSGQVAFHFGSRRSRVVLTSTGFVEARVGGAVFSAAGSDITYISILNPAEGLRERTYPISRKIAPGDVERFHIMLGSTMSCRVRVKFRVFIDTTSIIESDEFNLQIWNPGDSGYTYYYRDGSELVRDVERGGRIAAWGRRRVAKFPFTMP
jgi:hypothetical protein